jgi:peptide-methionine (S)-S-oxide reductase
VAETQTAIFGAGCFWGIEAAYRKVEGVTSTSVGYSGGTKANPTYEEVCSGTTGHAEVVRVEFDPDVVTFDALLDVFWQIHDPTTMNRQGPDIGTQYRSAIFYLDDEQAAAARASKEAHDKSGRFHDPIVTEITAASDYWMAEDYHQQYFEKQRGRFGRFF